MKEGRVDLKDFAPADPAGMMLGRKAAAGGQVRKELLRFFLFLLTDADLVHRRLCVLKRFMIVTSNGVGEE